MSKIYLILGASSDLGVELIQQLNGENSNCVFLAHYNSSKENLEKIIMNNGNKNIPIQADLGTMTEVDSLIEEVKKYCDAPTHIVHLAALPFKYMKLKEFDRNSLIHNIDVQISSFAKIMQAFLPVMAKRKQHDKVVTVLSSIVTNVPKFLIEYSIVKHALLGLVKGVASDYTGKKLNINAVSPSMIETKFLKNIDERIVRMTAEKSPESRNSTPSDIVPVIKFLLSEEANYIHGQNIIVDNGGMS